jgi:hypothetical protein
MTFVEGPPRVREMRIPWRLLVLIAFIEACESSISL